MKTKKTARTGFLVALLAAVALLCVDSALKDADFEPSGVTMSEDRCADFDFTRMNPTMQATYAYRLEANPAKFDGKTLRISGTILTRVDEEDGKRYFGCLMGDPGGCSCCAPGGVIEFMPKDSYAWPTNFPPAESRVTITGRLKMVEVGPKERRAAIPRLVDADMSWESR